LSLDLSWLDLVHYLLSQQQSTIESNVSALENASLADFALSISTCVNSCFDRQDANIIHVRAASKAHDHPRRDSDIANE